MRSARHRSDHYRDTDDFVYLLSLRLGKVGDNKGAKSATLDHHRDGSVACASGRGADRSRLGSLEATNVGDELGQIRDRVPGILSAFEAVWTTFNE